MYLAIMLIIAAILVFYNELDSKMNIAEIALLAIALIAIIRAAVNYIQMSDTITETFNQKPRSRKNNVKSRGKRHTNEKILLSSDSSEYFDTTTTTTQPAKKETLSDNGKVDAGAVDHINKLLNISKSDFANTDLGGIESIFKPQIVIGGDTSKDVSNDAIFDHIDRVQATQIPTTAFTSTPTSFTSAPSPVPTPTSFTSAPTSTHMPLNSNDKQWMNQTIDGYNNGKWLEMKKGSKGYENIAIDDDTGNLVVKNYTEAKKWYPGYTYIPPVYWDVPQRHVGACNPNMPNYTKLTGLVDRGLPINVLELNATGMQADTEDTVTLTNVGSILPKFNYQEQPFSKPYV